MIIGIEVMVVLTLLLKPQAVSIPPLPSVFNKYLLLSAVFLAITQTLPL